MEILPTDADLEAFVLDFFPAVQQRFGDGMQRIQKVSLLLTVEPNYTFIVDKLRLRYPEHVAWRDCLRGRAGPPPARWFGRGLAVVLLITAVGLLLRLAMGWPRAPGASVPSVPAPVNIGQPVVSGQQPVLLGPNSGNVISNSPGAMMHNEIHRK